MRVYLYTKQKFHFRVLGCICVLQTNKFIYLMATHQYSHTQFIMQDLKPDA